VSIERKDKFTVRYGEVAENSIYVEAGQSAFHQDRFAFTKERIFKFRY
jgi:hypothetical protein